MHRLLKIRIVKDLDTLEERVRLLRHVWLGWHPGPSFRPAADLFETVDGLVLRLEVAGVLPDDLKVSLQGQEVVVQGRRRLAPPAQTTRVLQHEMASGLFERRFPLSLPVDLEGIEARYAHGILEVSLKRPAPRRIVVKATPGDQEQEKR